MEMQKLFVVLGVLAALVVPASAWMVNEVTVTAGQLYGVGDDAQPVPNTGHVFPFDVGAYGFGAYDWGNGTIDLVLALPSIKYVAAIQVVNRHPPSSNGALALAEIYVAPNETTPGFDPRNVSNYTANVFANGTPVPSIGDADAVRTMDIADSLNRYFLIHITATWWGLSPCQMSDVRIVEMPPPANCAELIAWGFGAASDLSGDCRVNFADFAILAQDWLDCMNPQDANCL